jgi:selenocysteine lyase/cysteine desulfurase
VDFAATSSPKWLMGDFGLGFLYVREDPLPRLIRTHWSYESASDTDFHLSPTDLQTPMPVAYTPGADATRYFQPGTMASAVAAALDVSIGYIQKLGVANIQRHRQPMIDQLQAGLPRLGFIPQTPSGSTSPIVTFAHNDVDTITRKLRNARVDVRVAQYWMRVSPSVYIDLQDINRLLDALS